jgi:hypothetical protein
LDLDYRASLRAACTRLAPIHPDYTTLPVRNGFNWAACLAGERSLRLYLVVFRSVRREDADLQLLRHYDDRAYAEAVRAGGLLRYFKGEMNERRECLSFCLWESGEQAARAADGTRHRDASRISSRMYESYELERYEISTDPTGGKVLFQPLDENRRRATEVGAPA